MNFYGGGAGDGYSLRKFIYGKWRLTLLNLLEIRTLPKNRFEVTKYQFKKRKWSTFDLSPPR
jgi:hypothetical protein